MKRIAFLLALLMFILPVTANAATPRSIFIKPGISFEEDTAICTVSVTSNSMKDNIEVTVKLWQESSCIATWTTSGTGYVNFSTTRSVRDGVEYTLTADVTINGVKQPTASISRKS